MKILKVILRLISVVFIIAYCIAALMPFCVAFISVFIIVPIVWSFSGGDINYHINRWAIGVLEFFLYLPEIISDKLQ